MRFGLVSSAAVLLGVAAVANAQCSSTTTRKEIKSMSSAELNKYFNALKRMNSGSRPNQFDRFAQVHVWFAGQIHGYASFFPFHRQMLRDWEQTLQRVSGDPSVFQPYWDWTQDSQNPSASRVLSTSLFGGNSNGGCANIPNLGGQWPVFWDGNYQVRQRCLQRNFDNNAMRAYSSKSAIQTIMRSTNSFEQFAPAIEGSPHGMIHVSIGGDMNTMASPNDPIFWLHHAFIDKMWADWIDQNPGARQWSYGGRNQDGSGAGYYDALPYYGNPVWTVMPLGNMCYNYGGRSVMNKRSMSASAPASYNSTQPAPAPAPATPELCGCKAPVGGSLIIGKPGPVPPPVYGPPTDLYNNNPVEVYLPKIDAPMQSVAPLARSFIVMNNIDEKLVRAWERRLEIHVKAVNKHNGFDTPCNKTPPPPPKY